MFLLALIALSVLALLPALCVLATGSKAAVRAADREGMPERAQTNHPAHMREARPANDASSPSASAGVSPASESDDLETCNTSADANARGLHACPHGNRAHGPDLSFCTASPKPRIECGDADKRRATITTHPALL